MIGGGVLGALAGGVLGYVISKKTIEMYVCEDDEGYEYRTEDVINSIYEKSTSDISFGFSPAIEESEHRKEEIKERIRIENEKAALSDIVEEEEYISNIFDTIDEDAVEAEEIAKNNDGPYVISYEEYFETCKEYNKTTLGWYPHERILSDENNEPIPEDEWEDWVGKHFEEWFGLGPSHDGDVVFIRNPYNEHDYELIRFNHEYYDQENDPTYYGEEQQ